MDLSRFMIYLDGGWPNLAPNHPFPTVPAKHLSITESYGCKELQSRLFSMT